MPKLSRDLDEKSHFLNNEFSIRLPAINQFKKWPRSKERVGSRDDLTSSNQDICCNSELINSIDRLHCRAARIIFNLSKDMASSEVMKTVNWSTIRLRYKLEIFKLMYNAYKNIFH